MASTVNDSIGATLEKCLGNDSTTSHQVDCAYQAYDSWDVELNKNYRLILAKLGPKERDAIMASQRNWLVYRDSEFAAIDAIYYNNLEGTMYNAMRILDRTSIVEQRANQLKGYLSLLDENINK